MAVDRLRVNPKQLLMSHQYMRARGQTAPLTPSEPQSSLVSHLITLRHVTAALCHFSRLDSASHSNCSACQSAQVT